LLAKWSPYEIFLYLYKKLRNYAVMVIEDLALLFVRGLGSRGIVHLIDHFGSAEEIYRTPINTLVQEAGLRKDVAERIAAGEGMREAEQEVKYCQKHNICAIAATDDDYPELLREASDRPHVIFVKGNVNALHKRTLSMVGTRDASPSGLHVTDKLIGDLAAQIPDLCIVSGLAYGIDSACHRAALSHKAATIAVVADTLPNVSPAPNRNLAEEILRNGGALVSELHSQSKQNGQLFIARNRIIAALSMGTIVVESPASGGSLATADIADSYGRTLMAVPGRITDTTSFGSNNLIRTGKARMILTAADIIEELGWTPAHETTTESDDSPCLDGLSPAERLVYDAFNTAETLDWAQLTVTTGLTMGELAIVVMDLELKGFIRCLAGKRYERT
jgi:DNA processing protein